MFIFLPRLSEAASFSILPTTALEQLCGGTCQDDLVDLKGVVAGACTASEDVMVPPGDIAYPGMFGKPKRLNTRATSVLTLA